jgi:alanine-alpha-ketoisovalerate/valine-pyruvate aminotransferase
VRHRREFVAREHAVVIRVQVFEHLVEIRAVAVAAVMTAVLAARPSGPAGRVLTAEPAAPEPAAW